MQRSKGNENGEKTTIGLISKKATLQVQHTFLYTFLCHCFARLQRKTSRNVLVTHFMTEMSYVFFFTFFFTAAHFHLWPLVFLIFSTPLQIFHVVLPKKNVSSVFHLSLQLSFTLFLIELRQPVARMYFLFFSVFLFLCIPNCGHDN